MMKGQMKNRAAKKKTSSSTIKVLNKNGVLDSYTTLPKAKSFVRQHRCVWVSEDTIQLQIDSKDEKRMKEEVWAEANYVCYICGRQMHRGHELLTIDHMTPKRLGGSLLKFNLACCCKPCNEEKGCRTVESYTAYLLARIYAMLIWYGVIRRRDVSGERMLRTSRIDTQEGQKTEYEKAQTTG